MNWSAILENTVKSFIGINAVYFAIAAIGLNVQFGYAGLLNFGQAAFMAAGAYGLGMTAHYFDISFWWGIPIGIGYALILGLLMGLPTLRLRADYLAIVTIAAAEILRLIVRSVRFKHFFGGSDGINEFSGQFRDIGTDLGLVQAEEYGFWWFTFTGRQLWAMVVGWALVALFGTLVYFLMKSPWGRVLKAIREDEDAVRSLGKNVYSYKMQALILGGVIATFSGMIFSLDRGSVQPDNYSRDVTFYVLTALVLGGVARVAGSIVGPMLFWGIFVFVDSVLREWTRNGPIRIGDFTLIASTQVGQVNFALIGLLLILLMVYRPQGLFGNRKEMAFDGR
ncbi:MAG: branched-chain amino acid ABC transporter permease [Actinomycetota bacterium]|nr:MAG: branched-chain amino acid ABC transporter permease [Actinomycetota bacterium]